MKALEQPRVVLRGLNYAKHHAVIFSVMGILFLFCEIIIRVVAWPVPSGRIDMAVMSPWALVGYTSLWMFPIGGLCGLLVGLMNDKVPAIKLPYQVQVLLGGLIITVIELLSGLILNVWLNLAIWNYRLLPFNFMGQISLYSSLLWVALTPLAMWVDDVLRYYIAGAAKPENFWNYYRDLFRRKRRKT
ncbi:MAG: putative ABC transporter permease [Spirochaetes bacterium]|nr:putative ABC transporter permease [Spirochaetota bacterium]